MKERLRLIRTNRGDTIQKFADFLGVSKSNIESYEYGRRNPSDAFIKLICNTCGVNYIWLIEGTGPMYRDEDADAMAIIDAAMTSDNEFMKKMLVKFAKLDVKYWEMLKEIVDQLKD